MKLRTTSTNASRFPGPGDLPGDDSNPNSPNFDSSHDEAIDDLAEQWADDASKCREADDWNDGTQDGEHYAAVERALAELGGWGRAQVFGADRPAALEAALEQVYLLAQVHAKTRRERLEEMAAEEIDSQRDAA